MKKILCYFFLFILTILQFSCSYNRTVNVDISSNVSGESIEVDFLGATSDNKEYLEKCAESSYWQIENRNLKQYIIDKVYFTPNDFVTKKTIPKSSPIWEKWYDADCSTLYIVVTLAFITDKSKVNWKQSIPLSSYSWYNFWSSRVLSLNISKKGITITEND